LVVHERAEKVLAPADYYLRCSVGEPNRLHVGFRRRTVHLHAVLTSERLAVSREQLESEQEAVSSKEGGVNDEQ
jgi:hypothetical protein